MWTRVACAVGALAVSSTCLAWGAHGHRIVTHLAMERWEAAPGWLSTEEATARAAFQSNEADRWKGTPSLAINHENKPDHFIDVEHLWLMDMSLDTLPRLRRDYLAQMAVARHLDPDASPGTWDASRDAAKAYEYPGFLPHAIVEHYEKLRSSFATVRTLERVDRDDLGAQLEQARANAIYHMGMLSHFVGDASQPLHVTEHFNGWVGPNPYGYTEDKRFHAMIDSGALDRHGVTLSSCRGASSASYEVKSGDAWPVVLGYIGESFRLVEPLYALEKTGALMEDAGRAFLEERLDAGGAMLAALYASAWEASAPTEESVASFLRYGDYRGVDEATGGEE